MPEPLSIVILASARSELKQIATFTRKRWGVEQRGRYMAEIDKAIRMIASTPMIGELRSDLAPDVRLLPLGRHLIAYRVMPAQLQILGFPHQSMDLPTYFED